jgi:hypothetical protein
MRKLRGISSDRAAKTLFLVLILDFRPLIALKNDPAHYESFQIHELYLSTQTAMLCSTYLPNLRFIYLESLRIHDHDMPLWQKDGRVERPHQILLLSSCAVESLNCGWLAQYEALRGLMFLDISYTIRPEGFQRIFSTAIFPNLRVLKVRGLKLTDSMLPNIILQTGHRLWSLDIRDNLLTSAGVKLLVDNSLLPHSSPPKVAPNLRKEMLENPPKYERDPTVDHQQQTKSPLIVCRPDDEVRFANYLKAHGNLLQHVGPILDEQDEFFKATGLTHLYISGNKLNPSSAYILLQHTVHLKVLDIGCMRMHPPMSGKKFSFLVAAEDCLPLLHESGSCIEILRIHHSLVTGIITPLSSPSSSKYSVPRLRETEKHQAWRSFTPRENHHLRHLTLTDVPVKSFGPVVHRIIDFLNNCVIQEREFLDAAQSVGLRHRRSPKLLPGLRTLRLEFIAEDTGAWSGSGGSTSGDKDADEFLRESEQDFSFFDDKQLHAPQVVIEKEQVHDVVAMLTHWRKYSVFKWGGKLEIVLPHG